MNKPARHDATRNNAKNPETPQRWRRFEGQLRDPAEGRERDTRPGRYAVVGPFIKLPDTRGTNSESSGTR